jgi:hypothetical protein
MQAAVTGVRPPTLQDTASAAPASPGQLSARQSCRQGRRSPHPPWARAPGPQLTRQASGGSPTFRAAQASVRSRRCIRYGQRLAGLAATSGGWVLALCWRAAGAAIPACRGAGVAPARCSWSWSDSCWKQGQTLASLTRAVEAASALRVPYAEQQARTAAGTDPTEGQPLRTKRPSSPHHGINHRAVPMARASPDQAD